MNIQDIIQRINTPLGTGEKITRIDIDENGQKISAYRLLGNRIRIDIETYEEE